MWDGALSVVGYCAVPGAEPAAGYRLQAAVLNTPVAIVVSFTLPSGWAILTSSVRAVHSAGNWLDPSMA
jgi:hypothetical protein